MKYKIIKIDYKIDDYNKESKKNYKEVVFSKYFIKVCGKLRPLIIMRDEIIELKNILKEEVIGEINLD